MFKYIEENKEKIMATVIKVVASIIIPGGFIVWGAYELGKYKQRRTDDEVNLQENTQTTDESK